MASASNMASWFLDLRKGVWWPVIAFLVAAAIPLSGRSIPLLSDVLFAVAAVLFLVQVCLYVRKHTLIAPFRFQWPITRRPVRSFSLGESFYVGDIKIGADKLENDHLFEITITGFNASPYLARLRDMAGHATLECPGDTPYSGPLPPPAFAPTFGRELAPHREFHICLQQTVPAQVASTALTALNRGLSIGFKFGSLNLQISATAKREETARLPLWDGLTAAKSSPVLSISRVIHVAVGEHASVNAQAA